MPEYISSNDLRVGTCIEVDGNLYVVTSFQHIKPGKGGAIIKTKLRDINTGFIVEKTFRAGEKIIRAILEVKKAQYMYKDAAGYHFLNLENYEEIVLPEEVVGENQDFLVENLEAEILAYGGKYIGVELPPFIELKVVETTPGIRGDTASGGSKPATLETGVVIQVPLFVNEGDKVRVDTRTREYLERA
ncbi:MAG TPA: elongation factor P [Candidatus Atribacteria bacterium]|nr:elongation factor P [Candidatus Atribacteria bacterium]